MDRAVLRPASDERAWRDQVLARPARPDEPGKDRRSAEDGRRSAVSLQPGYRTEVPATALDWSEWGGYDKAVEMCNNNGHCRKFDAGTMCPSFRATPRRDPPDTRPCQYAAPRALGSARDEGEQAVKQALDLCVSCKGCKRECPTGVDMARMKIEFLAHYKARHGFSARERAIGFLPRYAPLAARLAPLSNFASAC